MHKNRGNIIKLQALSFFILMIYACSNESTTNSGANLLNAENEFYNGIGIGPVTSIMLNEKIDSAAAEDGKKLFNAKCTTCHLLNHNKRIGPGLGGVTKRRRSEWILNQIMNPLGMTQNDSLAKELLLIYQVQMTPMNVSREEAMKILEMFRKNDK
jgi:hypothetical protein